MKRDTLRKTTKAISRVLQLTGSIDARRQVALGIAKSAGMEEPAAVRLVERLAGKGER